VRSPRPLLQLEGFLDQKALARRNRDESRAAAQQQQPPYEAPSSEAAWTNHAVLLRIEQAFGFILDLEDIDLLITNSAIEPQAGYTPPPHTPAHTHTRTHHRTRTRNLRRVCVVSCRVRRMNLLNKRRDIAATLFSLLGINTQPPMAPRNLPAFDYDEEREPTYSLYAPPPRRPNHPPTRPDPLIIPARVVPCAVCRVRWQTGGRAAGQAGAGAQGLPHAGAGDPAAEPGAGGLHRLRLHPQPPLHPHRAQDQGRTSHPSRVVLCVSCVSCACACAVACVSCRVVVGRLTPNGRTSRR